MAKINASDINPLNTSIFSLGTASKQQSSLPSSLQSSSGNNVAQNSTVKSVNIQNIKNAINILEQKFSKNCCQANCNYTSTTCQTPTNQGQCYTYNQGQCYTYNQGQCHSVYYNNYGQRDSDAGA